MVNEALQWLHRDGGKSEVVQLFLLKIVLWLRLFYDLSFDLKKERQSIPAVRDQEETSL